MRFVTPNELGVISLAKIFFQVSEYLHFGTRFALDRYLPVLKSDESKNCFNAVTEFYLIIATVYILIVFFLFDNKSIYLIFALSGVVFVYSNFYKTYYRAKQKITKLNVINQILLTFPIICQIVGVVYYYYNGFVLSYFIGYIISLFIILFFSRDIISIISVRKALNIIKCKLVKPGFILFVNSLISFFVLSIDKVLIGNIVSVEYLGLYSVIVFFTTMYTILPSTLSELLFPDIIKNAFSYNIKFILIKYVFITLLSSVIFAVLSFFIIPFFVEMFIPKYINIIDYILWSLIILIPYSIFPFLSHYLNAIDKQSVILKVNLLSFFVYLLMIGFVFYSSSINFYILIAVKVFYFTLQSLMLLLITVKILKSNNGQL